MRHRLWSLLIALVLSLVLVTPALADTSYTVQPGDTLYKIARRFNVTVEAIVAANQLTNPNAIQVGQTLTIPDGQPPAAPTAAPGAPAPTAPPAASAPAGATTYTVQRGDSVSRVARKFGITIDELMRANNLTTTTLQVGQVLVIPGQSGAGAPVDSVYNRIIGDATFVRRIRAALDWLQAHDMDAYNRVNGYVSVIRVSPYRDRATASPIKSGGCLVRALARSSMSVEMVAALLFHEATHCVQFATLGPAPDVKTAEVDAYSQQIAFMERHGFPADQLDYYRKVLAYYQSQPDDGGPIPPPDF